MTKKRDDEEAKDSAVNRRAFLAGAATGAAAVLAQQAKIAGAQETARPTAPAAPEPGAQANTRPASDYMVDIFKSFGMEYMFSMCASSFIGIHESVLNYAGNKNPEAIACTHEEISVAMANGYAKIEGKPVLVCAHATVGAQHAVMALYDAWCDRVPVYLVLGNTNDAAQRTATCTGCTAPRIRPRSCATSRSGTTTRRRLRISPSRPCVRTRSR
jgi:acetolactate synthase-1/2/3 large subunit